MFGWLHRLLKKKRNKTMTFDIIVFEEDELPNGDLGMKQHIENGV